MARSYQGRKQSALCEGVQLLYEPTLSYQNSSLSWSHMYQGMNRKEPNGIMNGSEIELQVTSLTCKACIPCSSNTPEQHHLPFLVLI